MKFVNKETIARRIYQPHLVSIEDGNWEIDSKFEERECWFDISKLNHQSFPLERQHDEQAHPSYTRH
jgi:hypothetical protein